MKLNQEKLLSAFPQSSALFDDAVDQTLKQIHNQAAVERCSAQKIRIRRVLGWAMACALMVAGAFGVAEGVRRGVFDFLWQRGDALPQATELVQAVPAEMTIGHTTLRVNDVVYDGAAVRFVMSVRNDTVDRVLAEDEPYGGGAFGEALASDGVTALYSFDWFTIDGVEYSMTGGSGGENVASDDAGEALIYFELLLTQSEGEPILPPTQDFSLGLPVRTADTREAMQMFIPVKLVAANLLRDVTPTTPTSFGTGGNAYTVTVTQARLSPIHNAVELRVDVPDTVSDDAANAVIGKWSDIALVDESGAELGSAERIYWGLPMGETDDLRHFIIRIEVTPLDSYPAGLFVAPVGDDGVDLSLAIALHMEGE